MKNLINEISQSLQSTKDFKTSLLESENWQRNYPIAVINSMLRAKTQQTKDEYKELVDEDGKTPESYTTHKLSNIYAQAPESLQCSNFMILNYPLKSQLLYKTKHEKDFWKKIQNVEHIKSSFDFCDFHQDDDKCQVEFKLREIVRKRKEVHALKEVGLIWMAITSNDVSEVFTHYFGENYQLVDGEYHIGWSDKLKDINMRYFVCPPK